MCVIFAYAGEWCLVVVIVIVADVVIMLTAIVIVLMLLFSRERVRLRGQPVCVLSLHMPGSGVISANGRKLPTIIITITLNSISLKSVHLMALS